MPLLLVVLVLVLLFINLLIWSSKQNLFLNELKWTCCPSWLFIN